MSPGGLLSTGTGVTVCAADGLGDGRADGFAELRIEELGDVTAVGGEPVVVDVAPPPPHAVRVTKAISEAARSLDRNVVSAREITMGPQWTSADEGTMRARGRDQESRHVGADAI